MSPLMISRLLCNDFEVKIMRWALVLIFVLFGYAKWFPYEAQALIPSQLRTAQSLGGCTQYSVFKAPAMPWVWRSY